MTASHAPRPRHLLRQVPLALALLLGTSVLLWQLGRHEPVKGWLFFRYAAYWLTLGYFQLAVLAAGHALIRRWLKPTMTLEYALFAVLTGVLIFYLCQFLVGVLGGYGVAAFFAVPTLLLLAGAVPALRWLLQAKRDVHLAWERVKRDTSPLSLCITAFGLVAVVALYLSILTPHNVSYDARWYHLGLAEQYALRGGVERYPQGWFMGAYPHLASYLYTWAFEAPGALLFDKILLAAHLEFLLFLWTLVGVAALARAIAGGTALRNAWVGLFLFPGIFLYDSSLCAGADHVVAFFAAPAYLALLRLWQNARPVHCWLVAASLAGALASKYSAVSLVVFPAAAVLVGSARLLAKERAAGVPKVALAVLGGLLIGLVVLAPHWAKNWAFYGDPLYPLLHEKLALDPWVSGAEYRLEVFRNLAWAPQRTLSGVKETFQALVTFSFVPNNWPWMHGKRPVFGSLFTLCALLLPFLGSGQRKLWGLFAGTHVALFVWYWVQHEDRYLQGLLPWMAAATVVALACAWRAGWLARTFTAALVGAQVVWGLHVYFIPTHGMLGQAPIKAFADLAASGYQNRSKEVLDPFPEQRKVGELVGEGGVLLLHNQQPQLGFGVRVLHDNALNQAGLRYSQLASPADVYTELRKLGVTHLLWGQEMADQSLGDDLVFMDFVTRWAQARRRVGGFWFAEMPEAAPPQKALPTQVLVYSCNGDGYPSGYYEREDLFVVRWDKRDLSTYPTPRKAVGTTDRRQLVLGSPLVVLNRHCHPALDAGERHGMEQLGTRGGFEIWSRR